MTTATKAAALVALAAGLAAADAGDLQFVQRAAAAGLTGGHVTATDFGLQYMAPGAACGDFDRDGDQDIFIVGGNLGVDQYYVNDGNGSFTEQAAAAGLTASGIRHTGAAVGDFDNDGWLDLFVTCVTSGNPSEVVLNRLYRNNGNGTFTDVAAAAGVQIPPSGLRDSFGAAFGDVDLDGDLDIFLAGWYGGNHLYLNDGDGTFTVQPDSIFLNDIMDTIRGFGARIADINDDGLPDILLAADFFTSRVFINNGNGTFTNATAAWGAGLDSNGMGHALGDFNNDLRLDWYVTSRITPGGTSGSGNMLYMNNGDSTFTERSVPAGVNFGEWGWGADAVDFDHDGWLDIIATNGWNGSFFSVDPTHLWLNAQDPAGRFTEVTAQVGITHTGQGRGIVTFDADNDGDRDLLISNNGQPITYYENRLTGADAASITLDFDTSGEADLAPDGFGTAVQLDANGTTQLRVLDGGTTYLAQSELSVHFGIGAATAADEIRVRWANGQTTTLRNVAPGRHTITARLACPVDWNPDGVLDLSDLTGWVQAFLAQHPQTDLTGEGVLDLADLIAFVTGFQAGCP